MIKLNKAIAIDLAAGASFLGCAGGGTAYLGRLTVEEVLQQGVESIADEIKDKKISYDAIENIYSYDEKEHEEVILQASFSSLTNIRIITAF